MTFVYEDVGNGNKRVVDHERNIKLTYLGGGRPQEPIHFELCIGTTQFRFDAIRSVKNLPIKKIDVCWTVECIYWPPEMSKGDVKSYIKEVLDAYGFAASRDLVETLQVKFSTLCN